MDPVLEKWISVAFLAIAFIVLTWKQIGEKLLFWGRSDLRDVDEELDDLDSTELDENFPFKSLVTDGPNPKLTILYGTQTGTGQDLAQQLARMAYDHNFQTRVIDIQLVDPSYIKEEQLVCFILSTYGEGEPTDSAKVFTEWIEQDHNVFELGGVQYFVFGLGDSSYTHFNSVAKQYDKRLAEIGASRIFPLALGDAHGCLEEDFMEWGSKLLPHLVDSFSIELNEEQLRGKATPQLFKTIPNKSLEAVHLPIPGDFDLPAILESKGPLKAGEQSFFSIKNPFKAKIVVKQELHSTKSDRSCLHIEFELPNPKTKPIAHSHLLYKPGDHLGICPVNKSEWVLHASKYLQFSPQDLDVVYKCEPTPNNSFVPQPQYPSPTTYRDALTHYLDIQSVPKKKVIRVLADFASDSTEKEKLLLLSSLSPQGKRQYHKEIVDGACTLWDILDKYTSISIPPDHLFDLLPPLVPRYYSISSSLSYQPDRVSITSVLVSYTSSVTGKPREGVCTSFLDRSKVGSFVRIFIRASSFGLPENNTTPIIMVGPGTGIAPFRGFLQHRLKGDFPTDIPSRAISLADAKSSLTSTAHSNSNSSTSSVKLIATSSNSTDGQRNILFFGCRHPSIDYLYQNSLETLAKNSKIELFTAFSRLQSKKTYVQDLLTAHSSLIWELLNSGAYLYVCGEASGMSQDVRKAIENIIKTKGNLSETEVTEYIEKLFNTHRYQLDVW